MNGNRNSSKPGNNPVAARPGVLQRLALPAVACLTLGLAPFLPLPHFAEKIQWLATGHPLRPIDWFDLVLHGAPWVWLGVTVVQVIRGTGKG